MTRILNLKTTFMDNIVSIIHFMQNKYNVLEISYHEFPLSQNVMQLPLFITYKKFKVCIFCIRYCKHY